MQNFGININYYFNKLINYFKNFYVFSCAHCRANLARHTELISKVIFAINIFTLSFFINQKKKNFGI